MNLEVALSLIGKIIVFCVQSFEEMLAFMDGAKYYIAAASICITVRYLLGPLMGKAIHRGSDSVSDHYKGR